MANFPTFIFYYKTKRAVCEGGGVGVRMANSPVYICVYIWFHPGPGGGGGGVCVHVFGGVWGGGTARVSRKIAEIQP